MTPKEHEHVIGGLQTVIDDTQATLRHFEATGMKDEMREDFDKLLGWGYWDDAVKQHRSIPKLC